MSTNSGTNDMSPRGTFQLIAEQYVADQLGVSGPEALTLDVLNKVDEAVERIDELAS